jgi:serine/threonine-protein kinase
LRVGGEYLGRVIQRLPKPSAGLEARREGVIVAPFLLGCREIERFRMPENDGDPIDSTPFETTPMESSARHPSPRESGRHGRFIPGMLFGKRYRIAGLLGRGGMGEVYAADDLELGQTVALKFLPERLTRDESALAALRNEVRVARQISHPNVCRVYDIGDVEGHHFVTMEYVDGEDLAGLLRRIGRLPREKATEIVRQLAAGLSAAHEMGVLHRDLKPANVMIDGRGRVHIMDFGLAGFAEDLRESNPQAGTLTYMAPEQLAGKGASLRSDVYSLGIVMYEILTGHQPYEAASIAELRDRQASAPPSNPSALVSDCDPAVERVVMRCLECDPEQRPSSALAVAAALPGSDPLAAALAAGETPSPEMVAAAGGRGTLKRRVGLGLVGVALVSFIAVALLNEKVALFRMARLEKPPVVLADRAREILTQIGYPDPPADVAYGFGTSDLMRHIGATDQSIGRWQNLHTRRPAPYLFWYREWNAPMVPWDQISGRVSPSNPPLTSEGMVRIALDQSGRLLYFNRVPPARQLPPDSTRPLDWATFFSLAQLDPGVFREVTPIWRPPMAADERRAWDGFYPGADSLPVRVEAGASNGAPVYFRVADTGFRQWLLEPQAQPSGGQAESDSVLLLIQRGLLAVALPLIVFIPALIAWKNVRSRRGDLRSAYRFGGIMFVLSLINEVLTRPHYTSVRTEMNALVPGIVSAIGFGVLLGLGYLAVEPYLRRQWPDLLISWARLVSGRFRDPLVGRDVLVGATGGSVMVVLYEMSLLLPTWFGRPVWWPRPIGSNALVSGRTTLGTFIDPSFVVNVVLALVLLVVFLILMRRKLPAVAATFIVATLLWTGADLTYLSHTEQQVVLAVDSLSVAAAIFVLIRFGFLGLIASVLFYSHLLDFPVTLDTSGWYATTSMLTLSTLGAIALYAFHISTRGIATRRPWG